MNKMLATMVSASFLLASAAITTPAFADKAMPAAGTAGATDHAKMHEEHSKMQEQHTKMHEEHAQMADANKEAFGKLDANQDGMIDATEAAADKDLAKAFAKLAKDGKLDAAGFGKWKHEHHDDKH